MNAIFSAGCDCPRAWVAAGAAVRNPIQAHTVTARLITISQREEPLVQTPSPPRRTRGVLRSEEVAELEVQLEGRIGPTEGVGTVEAVRPVDADRAKRRDDAHADPRAAEQPSRVELAGVRPHVAGVEEGRDVEHLRQPRPHLTGHRE